jgi:hypothetical protein
MSKKGNYIGGSTVISTMTSSRAKFLDKRMYDHLKNQKPRKSDDPLDPEEVSKILHAEIKEDAKKQEKRYREHMKLVSKDKKLQERYEFLERKKAENPSQYPKLNKK